MNLSNVFLVQFPNFSLNFSLLFQWLQLLLVQSYISGSTFAVSLYTNSCILTSFPLIVIIIIICVTHTYFEWGTWKLNPSVPRFSSLTLSFIFELRNDINQPFVHTNSYSYFFYPQFYYFYLFSQMTLYLIYSYTQISQLYHLITTELPRVCNIHPLPLVEEFLSPPPVWFCKFQQYKCFVIALSAQKAV